MPLRQRGRVHAERLQRAGAVALHHDVGRRQQLLHGGAVPRRGQVEHHVPLADAGVEQPLAQVGLPGPVDAQHVGAVRGEHPGRHRPRDHAGQVQHAQPAQLRPPRSAVGHPAQAQQRQPGYRATLRGGRPLPGRPDGGRGASGSHHGALQLDGPPARGRRRHGVDVLRTEHRRRGRPVVRVVAVQPEPAVGGPPEPGQRREPQADRPPAQPHVPLAAHRQAHVGRVQPDRRRLPGQQPGRGQLRGDGPDDEVRHRQRPAQPGVPA